ncbi:response regulator transcription factor [Fibrella sp. HMF5335]|uniref:Response regulator transcription factor n=1 Tax=Fibrella rubiginis TaxID=2817060 RepID=A0A939K6K6_9BACT|nr:response regulator transcription factor [Fibrella rubiginis]MBO0937645.1 response regulator transcription factor [Fibrella rubiginis]
MTYKVALLDDHQVVLESFANLLDTFGSFDVVATATDAHAMLNLLDEVHADVLVTDLMLPAISGIDLISLFHAQHPTLAILVLSGSVDPQLIRHVMRVGANGFVTKSADKTELHDAIMAVAAGRRYVDSRVYDLDTDTPTQPEENLLTSREKEVADLIINELSSTQIAEKLFISFNTVETHRKRIYQKLGINTSLGLLKYSMRQRA